MLLVCEKYVLELFIIFLDVNATTIHSSKLALLHTVGVSFFQFSSSTIHPTELGMSSNECFPR
jgi:hypothetical protein